MENKKLNDQVQKFNNDVPNDKTSANDNYLSQNLGNKNQYIIDELCNDELFANEFDIYDKTIENQLINNDTNEKKVRLLSLKQLLEVIEEIYSSKTK